MNPQSLVNHYHHAFEKQRENVSYRLSHTAGFEKIQPQSDALLQKIVDQLHKLGLDSSNSVFAIDGSFSFNMAVSEPDRKSDLDGNIYLFREGNVDALEEKIDQALYSLGVESNLHLISSDWRPSRDDVIAKATQIGETIIPFLTGKYVWGEYDDSRLIKLIGDADKEVIDQLDEFLDERFWHMYQEGQEVYAERLKHYVGQGLESKQ